MSPASRVRMWRGGLRFSLSVTAPFVWRCLNSRTITPFPQPPHRTGQADLRHPALGQDTCLCTRKVIRSSPDSPHRAVFPRRVSTERSAYNRQCHHLGGHSLPGSQSGFFLRFSMWHLPQRWHTFQELHRWLSENTSITAHFFHHVSFLYGQIQFYSLVEIT